METNSVNEEHKAALSLDELTTTARLSGRIDLLMEMREWLDEKISAAEKANDQLRENLSTREAKQ